MVSEKNIFSGESFSYDVDKDKLVINNVELYIDEHKARVKFSEISVYDRVYLNSASSSYSTCEANNFDWQLNSEELLINAENNIGIAKSTLLKFKGIPLFYSPYLDFSINGSKKVELCHLMLAILVVEVLRLQFHLISTSPQIMTYFLIQNILKKRFTNWK